MTKKVLIIENHPLVRDVLLEYFNILGCETDTKTSNINLYSNYDFIIADYTTIKEKQLVEIISEIKEQKPVVIMSAAGYIEEKHLRERIYFIPKPFSFDDFKAVLNIAAEKSHREKLKHSLQH